MVSIKSIAVILAAAVSFVSAVPIPFAGSENMDSNTCNQSHETASLGIDTPVASGSCQPIDRE